MPGSRLRTLQTSGVSWAPTELFASLMRRVGLQWCSSLSSRPPDCRHGLNSTLQFAPGVGHKAAFGTGGEQVFVEMKVPMAVHSGALNNTGPNKIIHGTATAAQFNRGFGGINGS